MLPIKKLYIDSRFKSPDSVSDSDFYIDLPETLLMPEAPVFTWTTSAYLSLGIRSRKTKIIKYT